MRKSAPARSSSRRKSSVRRGAGKTHRPATGRFNVEFRGKAWVQGILTVDAKNEQEARVKAFSDYRETGIVWRYVEEDEEYGVRVVEVDRVC